MQMHNRSMYVGKYWFWDNLDNLFGQVQTIHPINGLACVFCVFCLCELWVFHPFSSQCVYLWLHTHVYMHIFFHARNVMLE